MAETFSDGLKETICALDNKTRMSILSVLDFRELSMREILSELKIEEPRFRYNVTILIKAGLVKNVRNRKKNNASYYHVTRYGINVVNSLVGTWRLAND